MTGECFATLLDRSRGWLAVVLGALVAAGCHSSERERPQIGVEMQLSPSPPVVGDVEVKVNLTDVKGQPLKGAKVQLEGNMNHAGMKPSFADLKEVEPGRYSGTLDFTMGGDWFVLVTVKMQKGQRVERKIDVPGVKTK